MKTGRDIIGYNLGLILFIILIPLIMWKASGAFTGEISPSMLKEYVSYVLIGHSERRILLHETDAFINEKLHALLTAGLKPILCVGETLSERKEGRAFDVIARELEAGLKDVTNEQLSRVTIAYEPIWAIGTGKTATPETAEEMHAFMHDWLTKRFEISSVSKVRLLYGGSLKVDNAKQLLSQPHIDGGLIGGASLKADSFVEIAGVLKECLYPKVGFHFRVCMGCVCRLITGDRW